ncbi:hypothetical protein [Botrimarina mediterranea]|uniref:Uncharacterized protein n=1 Tax=Botrimarina mediterranea TaxID=2528022 RepID=A0A518K9R6_9BACT|nr:hypothetical protein [Botrimarina mediterranea]QDV74520.1 hypothetical protein Spa11_27240 [Botrimarina mediterranea]QDV79160.1 hypothetical protein K2D_27710 [Planctomycetes bacterium K2D]
MVDNSAYDITAEIDPVEKLDDIQAKIKQRRREREQKAAASSAAVTSLSDPQEDDQTEAAREAATKKRAADSAKKKREEEERLLQERAQELRESRWITAGHKVREKRVERLDRIFYRLKADGQFSGAKQEFYDEGLALLEEKYAATGKSAG